MEDRVPVPARIKKIIERTDKPVCTVNPQSTMHGQEVKKLVESHFRTLSGMHLDRIATGFMLEASSLVEDVSKGRLTKEVAEKKLSDLFESKLEYNRLSDSSLLALPLGVASPLYLVED